jgi:hypothetical protein
VLDVRHGWRTARFGVVRMTHLTRMHREPILMHMTTAHDDWPVARAYAFARDGGPFSWTLFDGYLHGYRDGLIGDRRWIDACDNRTEYEKAVWCGFHDACTQQQEV